MNKKFVLLIILISALIVPTMYISAYAHELINEFIFTSYGISSKIHFGFVNTNDCPYNCQPFNYTAISWTQQNVTQVNSTCIKSSKACNSLYNAIVENESNPMQAIVSVAISIIIMLPAVFMWNRYTKNMI